MFERLIVADYIEGKRPVIEAIRAHVPLVRILLADNVKRDGQIEDILRKARQMDIPVKTVRRRDLDEKSERGSHQGVMAETKLYQYSGLTDLIIAANKHAEENDGNALIIMLDHITDAGNLGAIARSAEIVGASGIIIPNKRSAQVNAATYKSSAGAINHINCVQVANLVQVMNKLKDEGFWVAGASEHAQQIIWDAPLSGKIVLVMGSEGSGLARLTQENCDFLTKLPQAGKVGSLNVAQAATSIMYEWMRQSTHK